MIRRSKSQMHVHKSDGCWEGHNGQIHVEVKKTNSVRDVHGAFMALAYVLAGEPSENIAVCVCTETRLSEARLDEELARFRQVVHPAIANRIHFLLDKSHPQRNAAAFRGSMTGAPSEFYGWLAEMLASEILNGHTPQLPARQIVVATLAQLCLWNASPVTVKHLQETCRVSYPTVAAVLRDLSVKGWLEDSDERGVRMRYLSSGEWIELARDHARLRKLHLFTDPTGLNTPEQMVKRLARLQGVGKLSKSVRVGGVMGAFSHFPALDITAAPRLDLSVDADPAQVAALLDAGLRPKVKPEQRVALAVHVTRNLSVMTDKESRPQGPWAGELECLADLVEMGFTREASEMACHMELTNKEKMPAT